MMRIDVFKNQRGVTLVELIVSMVIISIALTGVLVVMNFTVSHSADPVIQHQAIAIAEAYMEEITLQAYKNPNPGGYAASSTKYDRSKFDDVSDYNYLHDNTVRDRDGGEITALSGYEVDVEVEEFTTPQNQRLGPDGNKVDTKKITVTVKRGNEVNLTLFGYRTEY